MEELVAVKQDKIISKFVVLLVLSAACFFIAAAFYSTNIVTAVLLAVVFSLCIIICIAVIIFYAATPEDIVLYHGGRLYFKNFSCKPQEVEKIDYRSYRSRYFGMNNGSLTVYYGGKKHKYQFVADIRSTYERLTEIIEADNNSALKKSEGEQNG
ncbi:MAG: hypothetical protein LUF82_02235 [Clostridia bacterium]|nr:hypothetical protein [Clostridia bacterium]